jgi:hypothetical protein
VKSRRLPLVIAAATILLLLTSMFYAPKASNAMPEFAQATGLQCSACHTMVPLLNAYGRYVQRTGYAAIDRSALAKTFPIWVGEQVNYDSTAGNQSGTPQFDGGNLAVHAVGYAMPDVTYHIQQWLYAGSQSGGLDTAWVAYHPSFLNDVHLFVGKIQNPAPSPYSQTSDIDGPLASSTVVGEHDYAATYNNRWGTKVNYVGNSFSVEAGYFLTSDDLNGISDFSPGDKTFQWKVSLAQAKSPFEVGVFGSNGSLPVSTGLDVYQSQAGYVQLDPSQNYRPGVQLIYQRESDSNPGMDPNGNQYLPASSYGLSYEVSELVLKGNVLLGYRHDSNNAGITGSYLNGNSVNVAFNIPIPKFPYLHAYLESNLGGNSALAGTTGGPQWKGMLWLTIPLVLNP